MKAAAPPPDTTAPNTSISSGPAASTTATSASLGFTSSESGASFECKLDSASYGACVSPKAYSGLAVGSHQFSVRAKDAAGNLDSTPALRSWTVKAAAPPPDTTAPNTSISSGPAASTTATSASLGFTSSESGASFECKLDSASYGACVSPKAYSGLAVGSHQFSVRAKDAAGNLDSTPALRSWTVKAAAPPPPGGCTSTVTSTSAAQSAVLRLTRLGHLPGKRHLRQSHTQRQQGGARRHPAGAEPRPGDARRRHRRRLSPHPGALRDHQRRLDPGEHGRAHYRTQPHHRRRSGDRRLHHHH